MVRVQDHRRLLLAGAVAAALVAAPALAQLPNFTSDTGPLLPTPQQPAIARLAADLGRCFAREDPACAEPLVAALDIVLPGSASSRYCAALVEFLSGRFEPARTGFQQVAGSLLAPEGLRARADTMVELAGATQAVIAGSKFHTLASGRAVVWLRPGADEVLLPYLDEVLGRTLPVLEQAFGKVESKAPIQLHVYARVDDLAKVSDLTPDQVRNSGTIALCKHNRVMITSPQDLVFGYAWADTVAHELVHWFVIKHGGDKVPVWLHEGLARAFQAAWRGRDPAELDADELRTLQHARKKRRFIPLAKMSPSLALLPTQDDTQLAFAEAHHATVWLLRRNAVGPRGVAHLGAQAGQMLGLFAGGLDFDQVLLLHAGLGPAAFQAAWKRELAAIELPPVPDQPVQKPPPLVFRGAAGNRLQHMRDNARRFAELGDRLAVARRPAAASIEYRKAIAAGGTAGPVLAARLVRVLLDAGRNQEADEWLQPALLDHPDHAPLYVLAARAHLAQGRPRGALTALEQAAWINPFDPQLHDLAAQAHGALGDDAGAAAARGRMQLVARTSAP
jgi:tetratricopeptide (TPR) repeat protein